MAQRLSGIDGVLTLNVTPPGGSAGGATAIAALRKWKSHDEQGTYDSSAVGDGYVNRTNGRKDWTVDFEALLQVASPYVLPVDLTGAGVAFVGKVLSSHTNGLVSGSGYGKTLDIEVGYDGMITISGQIECNGTGLVYDTSPAS